MGDSKKTKKELLAEIEALRAKLGDDAPAPEGEATGAPQGGITRRDVLASAWVAPVILTVPIGAAVSQRAQAHVEPSLGPHAHPHPTLTPSNGPTATHGPTDAPFLPTESPTPLPTASPSRGPTAFPTSAPFPTVTPIPVEISEFEIS